MAQPRPCRRDLIPSTRGHAPLIPFDAGDARSTATDCCSRADQRRRIKCTGTVTLLGIREVNALMGGVMRFIGIVVLLSVAIFAAISASTEPTFAAGSRAFCTTWLNLCTKTCPGGPGTCGGVCATRYSGCLSSGCFYFNVPGPRCQNNTADQAATGNVKSRMQKGMPVGCGPRFGRPCQ
jgi:hypothetical protein